MQFRTCGGWIPICATWLALHRSCRSDFATRRFEVRTRWALDSRRPLAGAVGRLGGAVHNRDVGSRRAILHVASLYGWLGVAVIVSSSGGQAFCSFKHRAEDAGDAGTRLVTQPRWSSQFLCFTLPLLQHAVVNLDIHFVCLEMRGWLDMRIDGSGHQLFKIQKD